jgi:hypothetical protein
MFWCMRTTIRLDDQLYSEAKKHALDTRRTFTALIEDALREVLQRSERMPTRSTVKLTTVNGRGAREGIDLDDSAELIEVMDNSDAAV